jgi:purine nucleosidase
MAPRPIIIDTDPGQDDAIAILLALASEEFEVLGITAVAGNVPLELTARNARQVCELAGRPETKVFAGCARPLVRPQVTAEQVHGKTGLDGPDLPPPAVPLQDQHAVDWIVETLRAAPAGSVTLCTLGPLTNIATAMIKAPDVSARIGEIVMMGGGFFEGGNTTPAAEFNVYVDPHAAHVVFTSGVALTMHPLDVTHKALMSREWIESLRALGSRTGTAAAAMLEFYERFDMEKYGEAGGPLHDPCVLAYLLRPQLFGGKDCNVQIETASALTMGMTVVDWWNVTGAPANCRVITRIDAAGYYALIRERLARLP